jgi:hypothetical protein
MARALNFLNSEAVDQNLVAPVFSASPVSVKKKRVCRGKTPVAQQESRRFTRSCLKLDGYRPKPVGEQPRPKKKTRSKLLLQRLDEVEQSEPILPGLEKGAPSKEEFEDLEIPPMPVHIMQAVGVRLGIDPADITEEK